MTLRGWLPAVVAVGTAAVAIVAALLDTGLSFAIAGVGFLVAVPVAVWLKYRARRDREPAGDCETVARREATTETAGLLADLRAQYERGDLSEAEFEAAVEDVLDSESAVETRAVIEQVRREDGFDVASDDERGEGPR